RGARVIPRATVRRVLVEGGRAVGVEADVGVSGDPSAGTMRLTVRAPQVVVAAGALRSPAILAMSDFDHPVIGRHLRLHPVPVVATLRHALVSMAQLSRAGGARRIVAVGMPPRWHDTNGSEPADEARAFGVFEEALRSFDFSPNRGSVFSAHQMGTVRMGADPGSPPA